MGEAQYWICFVSGNYLKNWISKARLDIRKYNRLTNWGAEFHCRVVATISETATSHGEHSGNMVSVAPALLLTYPTTLPVNWT